jgi:hypothetical protein
MMKLLDPHKPTVLNPTTFGFKKVDELLLPIKGLRQIPEKYTVHCNCTKCSHDRCPCHTAGLPCISFCQYQSLQGNEKTVQCKYTSGSLLGFWYRRSVGLQLSLLPHAICPDTQLNSISKTYNIQIQFVSFSAILHWSKIDGLIKHRLTLISIKTLLDIAPLTYMCREYAVDYNAWIHNTPWHSSFDIM